MCVRRYCDFVLIYIRTAFKVFVIMSYCGSKCIKYMTNTNVFNLILAIDSIRYLRKNNRKNTILEKIIFVPQCWIISPLYLPSIIHLQIFVDCKQHKHAKCFCICCRSSFVLNMNVY